MFETILIANRGEIACRIIATAHRLGIKTVAVYSDSDINAKHVEMAGQAIHIGPSPVAESYLKIDTIIAAAKAAQAQAIHPGYGFLSENPDFVAAAEAANLVFIGPSARAIRAMGLKDSAKNLMAEAGIPVVPGYQGDNQDPAFLKEKAAEIGYPVMIKARAGGGGKGMRIVQQAAAFADALHSAQREAQASFGDPVCLIEKFIPHPRHIEIQIFGDAHGNVIHLFERDCSLQRRHQKVIEEAPAPDIPQAVRDAMGRAAVNAAKAIGYQGAGTVEFIVDGSGPLREDGFWFMEMNTRLQVEHPVSEAITGLDFVSLQFDIAAGRPLPLQQSDLAIKGWSFEARIYAENAEKGFLPATGTLDHLSFPNGTDFEPGPVRIDSGVRQGDQITPWYDPMIAKLIVHGPDRVRALNKLRTALSHASIVGCPNNLAFLQALCRNSDFIAGHVDTGLIERDFETLITSKAADALVHAVAALGASGVLTQEKTTDPWQCFQGWQNWGYLEQSIRLKHQQTEAEYHIRFIAENSYEVETGFGTEKLALHRSDQTGFDIHANGRIVRMDLMIKPDCVTVISEGHGFSFERSAVEYGDPADTEGANTIIAPMPGLIAAIPATIGAKVKKDQPLIILEAMKMEHTLCASCDGTVKEIFAGIGDTITEGTILIDLDPESD